MAAGITDIKYTKSLKKYRQIDKELIDENMLKFQPVSKFRI